MSTEGAGKVCCTIGSPFIAALGAGVLVAEGIMWCGAQLEKDYNQNCQKWANLYANARAASQAQGETMGRYMTAQLEYMTLLEATPTVETISREEQDVLHKAIELARATIADASRMGWSPADLERQSRLLSLRREIEMGRTLLPIAVIQQAEEAPTRTLEEITSTINMLREARLQIEQRYTQQEYQRLQVEQLLRLTTAHQAVIRDQLRELGTVYHTELEQRQNNMQAVMAAARACLDSDSAEALRLATEAQRIARGLVERLSTEVLDEWNGVQSQVHMLEGTLTVLQKMVKEAGLVKMSEQQVLNDIRKRITIATDEIEAVSQGTVVDAQRRLKLLTGRVEFLKQDVFTVIETYQQQSIAETIAATLTTLGFHSIGGREVIAQENGDTLRVGAVRSTIVSGAERDDRMVSFDVSRDGGIHYDFSGYVGDTCLAEAGRIFQALRARGVFILEPEMASQLQEASTRGEAITAQTLEQSNWQVHPVQNKLQAELAERIQAVLERMQYGHVLQRAIGGSIELEAFNGSIGYHVILEPEGSMRVFRGAEHLDISDDGGDPVVAEAQQVNQQRKQQPTVSRRKEQSTYKHRSKQSLQEG